MWSTENASKRDESFSLKEAAASQLQGSCCQENVAFMFLAGGARDRQGVPVLY